MKNLSQGTVCQKTRSLYSATIKLIYLTFSFPIDRLLYFFVYVDMTTSLLHIIHICLLCGRGTKRKFHMTDIYLLCLNLNLRKCSDTVMIGSTWLLEHRVMLLLVPPPSSHRNAYSLRAKIVQPFVKWTLIFLQLDLTRVRL